MPPRRVRRRTRVLVVDGEVHVIVERRADKIVTARLRGAAARRAIEVIDDAQYGIVAAALGSGRRPP